jgi:hypothetical protein
MKIREGFWFGLHPYLRANSFILLQYFVILRAKVQNIFVTTTMIRKKVVPLQTVKQIIKAA